MRDVKQDLLTVANVAFDIRCDAGAYDTRTREDARGLWGIAMERLRNASGLAPTSPAPASVALFD